eukprot:1196307-Prorocentrum_minimum.AAC.1
MGKNRRAASADKIPSKKLRYGDSKQHITESADAEYIPHCSEEERDNKRADGTYPQGVNNILYLDFVDFALVRLISQVVARKLVRENKIEITQVGGHMRNGPDDVLLQQSKSVGYPYYVHLTDAHFTLLCQSDQKGTVVDPNNFKGPIRLRKVQLE